MTCCIAGQLTLRKMAIVSNVNLARVGKRLGLERYHALPLDADSWHPPGLAEVIPVKVASGLVMTCVHAGC